jgi:hypothetical protein
MRFRREEINSFHASDFDVDPETGTLLLRYALEGESSSKTIVFEERIELGGKLCLETSQGHAFQRLVRLIHAAAGTSYYKAAAPGIVSIDSGPLTASERRFVTDLYDKGLIAKRKRLLHCPIVEMRIAIAVKVIRPQV